MPRLSAKARIDPREYLPSDDDDDDSNFEDCEPADTSEAESDDPELWSKERCGEVLVAFLIGCGQG